MSFTLSGLVTELEHVPARVYPEGGSTPAHWRIFVASGRETNPVKLTEEYLSAVAGNMPQPGEMVHAEVTARAYNSRLVLAAVAPVAAPVPAPPKG